MPLLIVANNSGCPLEIAAWSVLVSNISSEIVKTPFSPIKPNWAFIWGISPTNASTSSFSMSSIPSSI